MKDRSEYTGELLDWRLDEVGRYHGRVVDHEHHIPHRYIQINPTKTERFAGHLKVHAYNNEVFKLNFDNMQSRNA